MSYTAQEQSAYLGNLVEHYRFVIGATVYRYTSAPVAQTLTTGNAEQNGTYVPEAISTSEPEHSRESKSTRLQITLPRANAIAQKFRFYPPETRVRVQVFRKHVADTEIITWWRGTVREADFKGGEARLDCTPTLGQMDGLGLWAKWGVQCNLQPYSARCGVNIADFTQSLTVTAINGATITVSAHGQADGWFRAGKVIRADGARRHIREQVGNVLTLILDFEELTVGETVSVVAGDDLLHETCRTKFFADGDSGNPDGNIANFLGVFTTPTHNPFTQGGFQRAGATGFASLE